MTEDATAPAADRWAGAKRLALFALGVSAVVYVVHDAGPAHVWATLVGAGVFVPLIIPLEAAFMAMDVMSLRALIGERARARGASLVCTSLPASRRATPTPSRSLRLRSAASSTWPSRSAAKRSSSTSRSLRPSCAH